MIWFAHVTCFVRQLSRSTSSPREVALYSVKGCTCSSRDEVVKSNACVSSCPIIRPRLPKSMAGTADSTENGACVVVVRKEVRHVRGRTAHRRDVGVTQPTKIIATIILIQVTI